MTEAEIGFTQRDELLAVLSKWYPSHIMARAPDDAADWPYVLCIDAPDGPLFYHISEERKWMFVHLPMMPTHFDGSDWAERTRRLQSL